MIKKDNKLQQEVKFYPAFDKRNPLPDKNYGVGAVTCQMILKGNNGAVTFTFTTGIYLSHVINEWKIKNYYPESMGYDVCYHSPKPFYEGQKCNFNCHLLSGGKCYFGGSSLEAQKWFKEFVAKGDIVIWENLEKYYEELFLNE